VQDVTSDMAIVSPQVKRHHQSRQIRRRAGSNADADRNAFYDAYGPAWVSTIYAAINEL